MPYKPVGADENGQFPPRVVTKLKSTIAGEVTDTASATRTALNATYASKGSTPVNVKDLGVKGDGSTDDSAALNAVLAAHKHAYFPPGTYMVSGITVSQAGSTLTGAPGAILKKRANGELVEVLSTATGSTLTGLTLDGDGLTGICVRVRTSNVTIDGCYAKNAVSGDATILGHYTAAPRLTIKNSTIEGTARVENGDNFTVDNCRILPSAIAGQPSGLGVWATAVSTNKADNARFTNNYIEVTLNGFAIVPLSRDGAIPPRGLLISGNTIVTKQNCYGGISIDTCGDATVSNNVFRIESGVPTTGALEIVKSKNVTATGNDFDAGSVMDTLIAVNNSSDCVISGNTLRNPNTTGFPNLIAIMAPLANNRSDRNLVIGNKFLIPAGSGRAVIISTNNTGTGCDANTVTGNSVTGNAASRTFALDAITGTVTNTVLTNNTVITGLQGFRVVNDTGTIFLNNQFYGVTDPLLQAGTGGTGMLVQGNSWQYSTAAPTTGYHVRGERVMNSAPAVGAPNGWVCTVSGTPGTWVALPNL